jgi:WD40 repeat protein
MAASKNKNINDLNNPFPGLRPFKVEESHLFFGREGQSEEILNKLSDEKFVAVIGASGSGKSSLIYCGLVPVLFGGFVGDANSTWKIIASRPGNSPIDNLANAIIGNSKNEDNSENDLIKQKLNSSILRSSSNGLVEALDQNYNLEKENVLIIIDQFEELFRYKSSKGDQSTYNESEAFVKLLISANKAKDVPVYIVLTMRSDFIGECSQFHELTELINESNYLVPQMTRDDFKSAIEGPVAVGGAEIETQLVQQLLNEVGDNPDQLPILQHALMRTWNYWTEHSDTEQAISISDYAAIGKMEKALSEHANEAFDELNEDEKFICESMFKTITEKGNDNRGIRHPTSISDIAIIAKTSTDKVKKVIDPFRAAGRSFITPSFEIELENDSIIDLSHESLMRIWNKLRIWVEEEWNAVQMYTRLSEASEMYQLGKTSLWRPPDLQLALNWRDKQKPTLAWAKRYNPAFERAMVYLKTSDKEFKAEEENKVKLQKRQLRRSKIFAIVLGSAAIIGVGLTIYSQMLKGRALKQEKIATEQKIEADKQKEIAEEQTIIAKEKEKEALEQKEEAEKQKLIAEQKQKEATRNAEIAERQTQIAIQRQEEANQQRALAEKNAKEARKQTVEAEKARQEALRRRMLSISQSMAVKSQQISDNTQLKALVAYQSYLFNKDYEGPKHNPDVYLGLYYALKGLEGQYFNALNGHEGSVMDIVFAPETNVMYSTGGDGKILKWDIGSDNKKFEVIAENPFVQRALEVTKDGKWLICATDQAKILLFNLENNVEQNQELIGHTSFVTGLAVAPDNSFFISSSNDKTIRKWNLKTLESEVLVTSDSKINSIEISPNSKKIAAGTQDGKISIYDSNNENSPFVIESNSKNAISSICYNKKGDWIVSGDSKGNVQVWDANNYTQIKNLQGHKSRIYDIAFNPNDCLLATSSLDGTVRVWDCTNLNNQPIELRDHESWVLSISFTPDGNKLVTSSNKKDRILIWDTKPNTIASKILNKLERNMSEDEWNTYVAEDIDYIKTIAEQINTK